MVEVPDADRLGPPAERLLTVGIPVFNGRSLLRNCLQSVVNSTLSSDRYEIVVVDDGSTEAETLAILDEFAARLRDHPGFFRVIHLGRNSGGAARPRNRILDEARGGYVFFVDADDTIGTLALERIAEEVRAAPVDWVALNQVPVNGRGALCVVTRTRAEVDRRKALSTLTVHKVFRRAEIERQGLRFDEGLPSGQDVSFAFAYLLRAQRFLMLGGYDYYYLTQHGGNPNEPGHLSRPKSPAALIEKNERILRGMLTALRDAALPEAERRRILTEVVLPRVLLRQGYLKAIVNAGPDDGGRALARLAETLRDPRVAELDPAELTDLTPEHLTVIAAEDWPGVVRLVTGRDPAPPQRNGTARRWLRQGRRVLGVVSGRARHRRLVAELTSLRQSIEQLTEAQQRLEARLPVPPLPEDLPTGGAPHERSDGRDHLRATTG